MAPITPAHILLVEDNPGDVILTRRTLGRSALPTHIHVVEDGESALDFVFRRGEHEDAPRPDLILLDINLPLMSGHDVLRHLKNEPSTQRIPVVMLTSSAAETDILLAYQQHANAYLTKGFGLEGFAQIIEQLENFWLTVVHLPPRADE